MERIGPGVQSVFKAAGIPRAVLCLTLVSPPFPSLPGRRQLPLLLSGLRTLGSSSGSKNEWLRPALRHPRPSTEQVRSFQGLLLWKEKAKMQQWLSRDVLRKLGNVAFRSLLSTLRWSLHWMVRKCTLMCLKHIKYQETLGTSATRQRMIVAEKTGWVVVLF